MCVCNQILAPQTPSGPTFPSAFAANSRGSVGQDVVPPPWRIIPHSSRADLPVSIIRAVPAITTDDPAFPSLPLIGARVPKEYVSANSNSKGMKSHSVMPCHANPIHPEPSDRPSWPVSSTLMTSQLQKLDLAPADGQINTHGICKIMLEAVCCAGWILIRGGHASNATG